MEGSHYYYNARYYDAELGRFLQADTVLDSLNRFAYCGNNPINYVDPTGHYMDYSNVSSKPVECPYTITSFTYYGPGDVTITFVRSNGSVYCLNTHTENDEGDYGGPPSDPLGGLGNNILDAFATGAFPTTSGVVQFSNPGAFGHLPEDEASEQWRGCVLGEGAGTLIGGIIVFGGAFLLSYFDDVFGSGGNVNQVSEAGNYSTKLPGSMNDNVGVTIDPNKFNYLFGKGTGNTHNIQRSLQNLSQMERIGIYNNAQGRALLQSHFESVALKSNNIINTFTNKWGIFQVKESLFTGPGGFIKFETTWQVMGNNTLRFISVKPFGG